MYLTSFVRVNFSDLEDQFKLYVQPVMILQILLSHNWNNDAIWHISKVKTNDCLNMYLQINICVFIYLFAMFLAFPQGEYGHVRT